MTASQFDGETARRVRQEAEELFRSDYRALLVRTDKLFGGLMIFQWLVSIFLALTVSPRTWTGPLSDWHPHLWTAVVLGGLISSFPLVLIALRPGEAYTRQVIAVAQMLYGAMLIHLTGGRIETHFHVFGSLAFLAFYRDWRVLITASAVVAVDHFVRGMFWPESVFGVISASPWRWLEHAGWVIFEDVFLISQCRQGIKEMHNVAQRHAELEETNQVIDARVQERTRELAEHRERLEETVRERTAKLQETLDHLRVTNSQLEQANMHRSRFMSTVSHELRTPMNAILGFADLLLSEGFGALNEKQRKYVQQIDDSGEHLLSLINDVLDVARIDVGAMALSLEALDPARLIESARQMISTQVKKKGMRIETEIAPNVKPIEGDERKAKQILINLLTNALKYSPAGEEIRITCRMEGEDTVRLSVIDRGVGIAEGEVSRIFEEFHQADRQRDEALGGIGLGLALCKRIAELHGGTIGVESTVGRGSEFWFTLPAHMEEAEVFTAGEGPKTDQVAEERQPGQRCILVVEDNETNLNMIVDMLSMLNHQLVIARNGQEGIELAERHHPDLILTDIRMPVLDGLETTRRLRANPEFAETPIVALTANASKISARECLDAGCTEHLSKPVKSKRLFAVVQHYLSGEPAGSAV